MGQADSRDVLFVRPSTQHQRPSVAIIAGLFCLYLLLGATGVISPWLLLLGAVGFGGSLIVGIAVALRFRAMDWDLRLDRAGVTVRGYDVVPWSDLAQVQVNGLEPRWLFWPVLGYRAVCFIAKPGIDLPALPSQIGNGSTDRARALRQRWYGTQLVVLSIAADATAETITDSVRRLSDTPVR